MFTVSIPPVDRATEAYQAIRRYDRTGPRAGEAVIGLRQLLERYVLRRREAYQIYARLPTRLPSGESIVGDVRRLVDDLEALCEGRLDVYGTADGLVVDTDVMSASAFDVDGFDRFLAAVETRYDGPYDVAVVRKRRPDDSRRQVTSYLVVPVRPLFPRDGRLAA